MGIVYVLSNPAFRGLLKIGCTAQPLEKRMKALNTTGVPEPYKCVAAWEFDDHRGAEKAFHKAFEEYRYKDDREFFTIKIEHVLPLLRQFGIREVTPGSVSKPVTSTPPKRKPPFRFSKVGIPLGAVLSSIWDENITCTAFEDQRVKFAGKVMSLTKAATLVAQGRGKTPKSLRGPACWRYGNPPRTLAAMKDKA